MNNIRYLIGLALLLLLCLVSCTPADGDGVTSETVAATPPVVSESGITYSFTEVMPENARLVFADMGTYDSFIQSSAVSHDRTKAYFLCVDGTLLTYDTADDSVTSGVLYTDGAPNSTLLDVPAELYERGVRIAALIRLTTETENGLQYANELRLYDGALTLLGAYPVGEGNGATGYAEFADADTLCYLWNGTLRLSDYRENKTLFSSDMKCSRLYSGMWAASQSSTLYRFDAAARQFTKYDFDTDHLYGGIEYFFSGDEIRYTRENKLYLYTPETGQARCIADFGNSGFPSVQPFDLFVLDDEHIFLQESTGNGNEIVLWRSAGADRDERCVITVAYTDSADTLEEAAAAFNRSQSEYRVELKAYQGSARDAIYDALDMDIVQGGGADIYCLPDVEKVQNYASKGLFADLGALAEQYADSDAFTDDLFAGVRSLFEEDDGTLCWVSPYVKLYGTVCRKETADALADGSVSALTAYAAAKGTAIIGRCERSFYLRAILSSAEQNFIRAKTGTCGFAADEFTELLTWMNTLSKKEIGIDSSVDVSAYRDGDILLFPFYTNSLSTCVLYQHIFGTDALVLTGFPHEGAVPSGVVVEPGSCYAVAAAADETVQRGAWRFLSAVFAADSLTSGFFSDMICTTKSAFAKTVELQTARHFYCSYHDETLKSSLAQKEYDENLTAYYRAESAMFDCVYNALESGSPVLMMDGAVYDILAEELSYFFAGVKNETETADIIQSRVSIYLAERQ
ncbi:MAG: extracellular solute-binding protein [Clostridia bacterium]|nr:extracellular solute-binding protein [Clostridia bacterium]